jgi:hypothetical protein
VLVLSERPETDAPFLDFGHGLSELAERPSQTVQLPDHQHITLTSVLERCGKLWPFTLGAGRPLGE